MRCSKCKGKNISFMTSDPSHAYCRDCDTYVLVENSVEKDELCFKNEELAIYKKLESELREVISENSDDCRLHLMFARHLLNRARQQRKCKSEQAVELYREAYNILQSVCNDFECAVVSMNIACEASESLIDADLKEEAFALLEREIEKEKNRISEDPANANRYADLLYLIPKAMEICTDVQTVLKMHDEYMSAHEILRQINDRKLPKADSYISVLQMTADALSANGETEKAVSLLIEGLNTIYNEENEAYKKYYANQNAVWLIAKKLFELGCPAEAAAVLQQHLSVLKDLFENNKKRYPAQLYAQSLLLLAKCCEEMSNNDQAIGYYEEVYRMSKDPANIFNFVFFHAAHKEAAFNLAGLLIANGSLQEAVDVYRSFLETLDNLYKKMGDITAQKMSVLDALLELTNVINADANAEEYENVLRQAIDCCEDIVSAIPDNTAYTANLASLKEHLARFLLALDRTDEGAALYREAVALFERASEANMQDLLILNGYITTCFNCGKILDDAQYKEKAVSLAQKFSILPISKIILEEAE